MKRITIALLTSVITVSMTASAVEWQALPEVAPAPKDNPTTAEKVTLGKMLYFDTRFSETGTVSCFSCHNIMEGGDDHRSVSIGVHGKKGGRNSPTVWNSAFHATQFWDGRAASLEDQAKGPVVNPVEMGMTDLPTALKRVKSIPGYKAYFDAAFGAGDSITIDNAAKAVAAYERTLITPNSPYDLYVKGDKTAMTKQQIQGMETFAAKGCIACHSGAAFNGVTTATTTGVFMKAPTFSDNEYVKKYALDEDKGRYEETKKEEDKHLWRVPTLRNLTHTAPYMHNGKVKTMEEAVKVMAKIQLNTDLTEKETTDIVAFLSALTGKFPQQTMPQLPPASGDLLD